MSARTAETHTVSIFFCLGSENNPATSAVDDTVSENQPPFCPEMMSKYVQGFSVNLIGVILYTYNN